ncbi:hypothetical protein [Streptomyces sp. NPDC002205]|uniref:hypothetical protein n=1 Tax=Streptomyces sp. NPDC002205 TaxID=3154411 RepID=UPI003320E911
MLLFAAASEIRCSTGATGWAFPARAEALPPASAALRPLRDPDAAELDDDEDGGEG